MGDFLTMKNISTNLLQLRPLQTENHLLSIKNNRKNSSQEIKSVCKEFESLFLNYLLKEMRATIPKSGLFEKGQAERIYTSMFDEQLSKELAQKGGIGLAQMLEKCLSQYQNSHSNE